MRPIVEWHARAAAYPTETASGDDCHVLMDSDHCLAFAIDALGHGAEASKVAEMAKRFLMGVRRDEPLEDLIFRCHSQLKGTRGAAICLASIDAKNDCLTWLSVGNIQGVLIRVDRNRIPSYESMIMRGGVVGDRLPELQANSLPLKLGDMIVFATDGVDFDWFPQYNVNKSARGLASSILKYHKRGDDDALVLAMKYNGSGM